MDIDEIQTFVAIAEFGGFTRAAQRLHRSQPAISRRLGLLEQELGAHGLARVLESGEGGLGMGQEGATGLGQPGVAADAFEQRRAQFLFQQAEAAADGGLRTMQSLSGAGEAAEFGDGDEGLDLVDIHGSVNLMKAVRTMHFTMIGDPTIVTASH